MYTYKYKINMYKNNFLFYFFFVMLNLCDKIIENYVI